MRSKKDVACLTMACLGRPITSSFWPSRGRWPGPGGEEYTACLTTAGLNQLYVCRHLGNVGQVTGPISVLNALHSHCPTFVLKCTTQLPQGELSP